MGSWIPTKSVGVRVLSADKEFFRGQVESTSVLGKSYYVHLGSEHCECGVGYKLQPMACKHAFALAVATGYDPNLLIPDCFNHNHGMVTYSRALNKDANNHTAMATTLPSFDVPADGLPPPPPPPPPPPLGREEQGAPRNAAKPDALLNELGHYAKTCQNEPKN